ncbi:LysR family transcriptional regulator [Litoribacillus peritrichatus]|uniref:LysR family transcriptional regulator n=1 Tax=Litoribacillus peritrichatus TaxID=718191 RepID=A0ABP7MFI9_9GAMM
MAKIDDMELFVHVVKAGGLAAAGRKLGLSPASMTARMNQIEKRYDTRLLTRNTRNIALTEAGERFYYGCLKVLEEVAHAENGLQETKQELSGSLRVAATSDFGRQYVSSAIAEFVSKHPKVRVHLMLADGLINIIDEGVDLAIRFGNLPDSNLISRPIMENRRVLCASPEYIHSFGEPLVPEDLAHHRCLVLERHGQPLNDWHFESQAQRKTLKVTPYLSCSDGDVIRQWALQGYGIVMKSLIDVKKDIADGRLVLVLEQFVRGFSQKDTESVGLQAIYPSRQYQPRQVKAFLTFFTKWVSGVSNSESRHL